MHKKYQTAKANRDRNNNLKTLTKYSKDRKH